MRKSIYEWAVEYCGDPSSFAERGELIVEFLKEEGLQPHHRVLDVGCGALSQGKPLIEYLNAGGYVGLDPNGWLIEAALQEFPYLLDGWPIFSYSGDFLPDIPGPYDFIVSHSVLSHAADWQLGQAFGNLRRVVDVGAVCLASIRLARVSSLSTFWVYPGNTFFRLKSVVDSAHHFGWSIEEDKTMRKRLMDSCPQNVHNWLRLRAV